MRTLPIMTFSTQSLHGFRQAEPKERVFSKRNKDITLLISVVIEELMLRVAMPSWDPPYKCFMFDKEDLALMIKKYSILISLELQCPNKVYVKKLKMGSRKKLTNILRIKAKIVDPRLKQKRNFIDLSWNFLKVIKGRLNNEHSLAAFFLAIYRLVIFPRVLGYDEVVVIDFFEQVQYDSNPFVTILVKTVWSLNYCHRNKVRCFMGVHHYYTYASDAISLIKRFLFETLSHESLID